MSAPPRGSANGGQGCGTAAGGRGEEGIALPVAVAVLAILLTLTAATLAFALRRMDTSHRDRSSAMAQAAADAGADVAGWRMNRMLVPGSVAGVLGVASNVLETTACADVTVGGALVLGSTGPSGHWCQATTEQLAPGVFYTYRVRTGIAVGTTADRILVRRVAVSGTARGVTRRILVTFRLRLQGASALSLFQRGRYVECPAGPVTGADPDAGCPDPGT